ncbi:MAG: PLP-dependent aminotransferase family protein [Oceanibaculum nanhaiense]|uniref:MocR-like pyridoxine biosynthesis transcription factor PdxR n=1 Tax=Oceanibaculum nanhaiense TaxID=1909734 RepID=UPI0025A3B2EC|nr:PLP-dependent aminotransferase family protein [Oceanibaculum nanhaiense]MDM7945627.1 PLP-dependent aminotransferase family protein [Oceanibaculum nanhaiense]
MRKHQTNFPDWSALIPVLPAGGPRRDALQGELRRLIETRVLLPGQKLPPSRELAQRLKLARGAVVAAYEQLAADGFVEARLGAGTFVAALVPEHAALKTAPQAPARTGPTPPMPGKLGSGTVDDKTLRDLRGLFRETLMRPPPGFLHYGDPFGDLPLRREIVDYLRATRGIRADAGQVMITSGTQSALSLIGRALLQPKSRIWVEDPCYPQALNLFRSLGLTIIPVPVDRDGLDPAAGVAAAPEAEAVYLTPSHQYPLGTTLSMPRRLALLDWAQGCGAWIIEDDYDSEFRFTGPPLAALHGIDRVGRVIYLGTFSKALAPGLRLGYAVLPTELVETVHKLRDITDRYPNPLIETVLARFMAERHYAAHLRRARKRCRMARDALVEGLSEAQLDVTIPDQGLHLIANARNCESDAELQRLAQAGGLASRRLSELFIKAPTQQGLVIGYSCFEADEIRAAASGAARAIALGRNR